MLHASIYYQGKYPPEMWWLKKNDDRLYLALGYAFPVLYSLLPFTTHRSVGKRGGGGGVACPEACPPPPPQPPPPPHTLQTQLRLDRRVVLDLRRR